MIEIIDDFLTNDEFNQIYNLVSDLEFPWFFGVVTNQSKYCQFTHCFYQNDEPLAYFKYVRFLRSKLQMRSLVRIKVNINPWTENLVEHTDAWHIDYPDITTAILYLNTNNGYTMFETGEKVSSIKNRLVKFDSNIKHTGTTCTDEPGRLVLNINYL